MKFETFTNGSLLGRQHKPKLGPARCGCTYLPSISRRWLFGNDRLTNYVRHRTDNKSTGTQAANTMRWRS